MVKKKLIADLVEMNIIGGQITSRIEAKDPSEKHDTMKVLIPKAISNGRVSPLELTTLDVKIGVDSKRITQEGDIVMKLSTPYDACIITKEDEGLLVPSFCVIIKNVPNYILKEYLVAYLNSKACSIQIKALVTGATIAILSSSQIRKISVPVPELNVQKEIASTYVEGIEKLKLLEKINRLEKEYLDSRFLEMEE